MNTTKKLIVTETLHYEFELPPDHPEDRDSLLAMFCAKENPWSEAAFAAVIARDVEVETWQPLPPCLTHEND